MELYSILVDFPPTFYCLPKPLFLYRSMVLLFIIDISTILLTMYYIECCLCFARIGGPALVINISVQYNGGFPPDIILLNQGYYHWGIQLNTM